MAAEAEIPDGGLVTYTVKVAGDAIPDSIEVHSMEIEMGVNKIAEAKIIVLDGDPSEGNFEISSGDTFVPGKAVVIEAGYDNKNKVIYKGIITKQVIQVDDELGPTLEIECRDQAIKMAVGRNCLTFSKKKDSEIISSIIGNYSDLENDITDTTYQWPEQVQYYVSDWDYILTRAEANGMIVTDINNKVSVVKPDATTTSVITVEYGENLLECKANLNSVSQLGSTKASSWDFKTQAIVSEDSSNDHAGAGNITSKKLSDVVGLSDYTIQTTAPLESSCLTDWTKAQLVKSEYAKILGDLKILGTDKPLPGTYITLAGLGDRLNGDHIVGSIVHEISDGDWTTEVSIGLSEEWFSERPDVMAPSASGLLPGVSGLMNGTVKKMYEDPDSQYRILVDIPMFDANGEGIWARLSNFYSTNGAGVFFMPEVGDEVVLGFLNEDPRFPIILGSLYSSSKLKPSDDYSASEKNPKKAIVSKSGITIEFDDENKVFTINTPAKNTVILSDKDKKISLKDQNDNSIEMSDDGITIKSSKAITIQSEKKVEIKGDQGISVESSSGDVETKGTNIKETANAQYTAKGSASAEVQGGGELTLKGAMVKIN